MEVRYYNTFIEEKYYICTKYPKYIPQLETYIRLKDAEGNSLFTYEKQERFKVIEIEQELIEDSIEIWHIAIR